MCKTYLLIQYVNLDDTGPIYNLYGICSSQYGTDSTSGVVELVT